MRTDPQLNLEAARDPQPGDFWHEMLTAICLVVARDGEHVCICRRKQACDDGRHFVFIDPEWMTVDDFGVWLRYATIPDRFWADLGRRGDNVSAYEDMIPKRESGRAA